MVSALFLEKRHKADYFVMLLLKSLFQEATQTEYFPYKIV